jgi:predicted small metal-binding protein
MTTQDRIDKIRKAVRTVVENEGTKLASDGHCTFGVEYPAISRGAEATTYFSALDLHGRFTFLGKSMGEVLNRVEKHLHDKHNINV